ncbi:MAG: arylsulfatase [Pirellulales bacterium]
MLHRLTTCLILLGLIVSLAAAEQRPNVIVVMTDDQGYGDLSCHGNPVVGAPPMDRLHDQSVRFTDFHVAPMCTPTRGQLMTGLDAFRNGAMNVSSGRTLLRRHLPTMADAFAATGYATGMFGKWHLGDNYPFRPADRGFQESLWFPSSHISSTPDFWNNDYFDDTYTHNGQRRKYDGYCTDVFFAEAMKWIAAQSKAGKPFFAYIPLNAPHGPLFVPDRYRAEVRKRLDAAQDKLPEMDEGFRRSLVSFLAMIENADENIGRLEAMLDERGLRDNTLLIFLTDNGSTMGPRYYNAGMKGGKVTLWEGGHRVPLFVRWPHGGFGAPRDVAELTHVQDLLPTLIDVCDLKRPTEAKYDGVSLDHLLRGKASGLDDRMLVVNYSRMPFGVKRRQADHPGTPHKEGSAVLWKRWRLLENDKLFDLTGDPMQERNVIDDHPEVAAKMRARLDAWWNGVKDTVNEPSRVVVGADAENPTMLSACEWFDVFVDQQRQVRIADEKFGVWYLDVAEPDQYTIELRRYPREADLAINAAVEATQVTDGRYPAGKAIPAVQARLRIGKKNEAMKLAANAKEATFRVSLEKGPIEMQTVFLDDDGNELCGAYYAYVRRE